MDTTNLLLKPSMVRSNFTSLLHRVSASCYHKNLYTIHSPYLEKSGVFQHSPYFWTEVGH